MKKLFTILAAMLISMVGFAQTAATLTFDKKAKCTSSSTSQQVWEENGITLTNDKAASSTNVAVYAPVRLYASSAITIKCSLGNIAQIEFVCDTYKNTYPADLKRSIGAEATVSGTKVTVTPTATSDTYAVKKLAAQVRLKSVTVTYVAAGTDFVSTPSIGGDDYFVEKTTVSMKAAEGAKIYYTLDGTEPTNASTEYTAPFELTETTTVKAIAYEGEKASDVVTVKFVKMQVLTCAEAAAACTTTESADKYIVRGYVTTLVDGGYSTTYKNTTVWMADAADGGNVIQAFRLTPVVTADQQVKVGDYIEAIGTLKKFNTTPEITGGTYTIIPAPAPAATVVTVENTTVSEMGQNIVLSGAAGERNLTISLWQGGATQGFGTYSGAGEGDYYGSITNPYADLAAAGDATYTDNGNGTFTFKAIMTDGTAQYDITMNGLIPVKHTYTVAGSSDVAFGTAWDPTNAENDMFLVSGTIYGWEKYNLTLSAGDIMFKVCEDHAWTTAYPAQNYVLTIPADGIYTIMIMFDAASKTVEAFAEKTGDAVVIPTVAMHGNFVDPNWADTENFTLAADELTATLVMTLAVGNYEFGMRIGGKGDWTSNGVQFTRENASAVVVAGSGNLKLVADVAGEYTFTWTYATNTLAITFPAKEEPQPVATWDEIVFTEVAAKGSLNGAVFTAATNAAFTLTVTDTDASKVEVDANTASFGTAEENATYTFRLKTGGKSSAKNVLTLAIPADGKLRIAARPGSKDATDRNIVVKQGETELYNQVVLEEKVGDYYSYVLVDVKQGTVTIEYPVNSLFLYAFGFQAVAGPTVGFENIEATEKAVKFIENGQIFILRDGAVFNLMGARVK
ncbi:MAG: FN3 associated domain-containing protein [Paludibacteraceae bacterium]|nr:FN3 associated domain-containing protein [Paludibacteraceae bacterium]